jgi:ubiquinone/menaquinone biosynthesis C-methylase UbiE
MRKILTNVKYHIQRKTRIDYKYRWQRRTREVMKVVKKYQGQRTVDLLDIGCADGLMLGRLKYELELGKAFGIDPSRELIGLNKDLGVNLLEGVAENLPFGSNEFDVITALAVIEHIGDIEKVLYECRRVLRDRGIIIISTPNPFFDKIATLLGYFKKGEHVNKFSVKKLRTLFESRDYKILIARRFMLFPLAAIPFEDQIESVITFLGLDFFMSNQLIVIQVKK